MLETENNTDKTAICHRWRRLGPKNKNNNNKKKSLPNG